MKGPGGQELQPSGGPRRPRSAPHPTTAPVSQRTGLRAGPSDRSPQAAGMARGQGPGCAIWNPGVRLSPRIKGVAGSARVMTKTRPAASAIAGADRRPGQCPPDPAGLAPTSRAASSLLESIRLSAPLRRDHDQPHSLHQRRPAPDQPRPGLARVSRPGERLVHQPLPDLAGRSHRRGAASRGPGKPGKRPPMRSSGKPAAASSRRSPRARIQPSLTPMNVAPRETTAARTIPFQRHVQTKGS